jgi:S1-C subfamily serine protease
MRVASVTKSVTSTLVGIAADEGALSLDDRVSSYVPEWRGTRSEAVTIRDLLSNSSGRHWDLATDYGEMVLRADDKTSFAIDLDQGGLVVVAVRANSPADEQGITPGDILVGMHDWETVSFENLDYVLRSKIWTQQQMVRFYILRDKETLFGNISVADSQQLSRR